MLRYLTRATVVAITGLAVGVFAMACGGDGDGGLYGDDDEGSSESTELQQPADSQQTPLAGGAEAPSDAPTGTVNVTVQEYEISTDPIAVPAGEVTFRVRNAGPDEEHEFIVIRTDVNPVKLPTGDDGSVTEEDHDVVGEIEPFAVGETEELTLELTPGAYVLICNVVNDVDGVPESHHLNGMRESFRVDDPVAP